MPAQTMAISSLSLSQFRNHADSRIMDAGQFNVLTGLNGAGKTNILEAISLLAPGRGLRRATFAEMASQAGPGGFAISAELVGTADVIGTGCSADAPSRRQVRINGATHSAQMLGEWLSIIWLTPAMDRLFVEATSGRRRFLDRLVLALHPGHAQAATRYEAAMRERNRLLGDERPHEPAWLDALEARMADYGSALYTARQATVAALEAQLERSETGVFARPSLALMGGAFDDGAMMASRWRSDRGRDRAAGRTLYGPHRADLSVELRQKRQAAALCSTGEQKAMLIAIILAHADLVAERDAAPLVLLLDEVAAHLDSSRRAALYEQLAARGGQVWMTGTDSALFEAVPKTGRRDFVIENGIVSTPGSV